MRRRRRAEGNPNDPVGPAPTDATGATADPTADPISEASVEGTPGPTRAKRGWSGTRLVALIAGVAVVSLLIGVAVMQFIVSPADIAARTAAPDPGPVTAPVEERVIENTVVTRGEVTYADAVEVTLDAAGSEDRAVITGHVPKLGAVLKAGNIALEVAGRPVIVMPGGLPAYRTLSVGMRGPDVVQLKQALNAMGYAAGDPAADTFDWDTASALGALYEQIGYDAAAGGEEAQEALRGAERALRDANVALAEAQAALTDAQNAKASSTAGEQAAVTAANDAAVDAQEALADAQEGVLPTLPSSEVLFLSDLPRRVDDITVERGDVLSGSPMSVSGATLTILGTVSKQDAELLTEGVVATFKTPGGENLQAKVSKITSPKSGGSEPSEGGDEEGSGGGESEARGSGDRYTIELDPGELTSEQIEALRDTNVRMRIAVASTEGEVLAVPIAALSAGSGGEDRVELLVDPGDGKDAKTEIIPVTAGLAAEGFVEITSSDKRIKPGAKVVVGR